MIDFCALSNYELNVRDTYFEQYWLLLIPGYQSPWHIWTWYQFSHKKHKFFQCICEWMDRFFMLWICHLCKLKNCNVVLFSNMLFILFLLLYLKIRNVIIIFMELFIDFRIFVLPRLVVFKFYLEITSMSSTLALGCDTTKTSLITCTMLFVSKQSGNYNLCTSI